MVAEEVLIPPLLRAPSYALPLMRALSAALLTLALLSSIVPLAALSSSHSCSMPCCAGVEGGCATGACQGALFKSPKKSAEKEEEEEKLCGAEITGKAHGAKKSGRKPKPSALQSAEAGHCDTDREETASSKRAAVKRAPARAPSSTTASGKDKTGFISSRALAAPCGKDCCAAASTSTQSKRGRDTSLAFLSSRLAPPALSSASHYSLNLPFTSNAHLKRLKARAPPYAYPYNPA